MFSTFSLNCCSTIQSWFARANFLLSSLLFLLNILSIWLVVQSNLLTLLSNIQNAIGIKTSAKISFHFIYKSFEKKNMMAFKWYAYFVFIVSVAFTSLNPMVTYSLFCKNARFSFDHHSNTIVISIAYKSITRWNTSHLLFTEHLFLQCYWFCYLFQAIDYDLNLPHLFCMLTNLASPLRMLWLKFSISAHSSMNVVWIQRLYRLETCVLKAIKAFKQLVK